MRRSRGVNGFRAVLIASTVALAVSLGACATDSFADYMSQGCEGLRQMVSGHAQGDQSRVEAGSTETGAFHPAGEEAAGDVSMRAEVAAATAAGKTLFIATFEPPERNQGALISRHRPLTPQQQDTVNEGLAVCDQY